MFNLKHFIDMSIMGITTSKEKIEANRKTKTTRDLTFISGESNPLLFLAEFENCQDVKADHDKTYKIRHFVDDEHKSKIDDRLTHNNL